MIYNGSLGITTPLVHIGTLVLMKFLVHKFFINVKPVILIHIIVMVHKEKLGIVKSMIHSGLLGIRHFVIHRCTMVLTVYLWFTQVVWISKKRWFTNGAWFSICP